MPLATFAPVPRPTDVDRKPEVNLKTASFGDGYTQDTRQGLNHIRDVLSLSWELLTPAQAAAIDTFFTSQGGDTPFYFQRSDGVTKKYTCREWGRKFGGKGPMTATLREYFGLQT